MATGVVSDLVIVAIRTAINMPAHASGSTIHHLTNGPAHVRGNRMAPHEPMVALPQDTLNGWFHEAALDMI